MPDELQVFRVFIGFRVHLLHGGSCIRAEILAGDLALRSTRRPLGHEYYLA